MDKLTAAIQYAEMGYRVFPCVVNDKRPATLHGCKDATTDENQILEWWEHNPDFNIGVATDGLLVVDIDGTDNRWMDGAEWQSELIGITPRGGKHVVYRQPQDVEYRNTASTLAPSVDTRANGGYILVEPSIVNDRPYRWAEGFSIDSVDQLSEPPEWLQVLLAKSGGQEKRITVDDRIPKGGRNAKLTSIAGSMRRNGLNEKEILAALKEINKYRCNPPCPVDEVEKIAWSVGRYEPDQVMEILNFGLDDDFEKPDQIRNPGKMPKSLYKVPGLIGDIVNHNLKTAYKPQPELALAAALALMGTITGRKVRDYRDTRTNIYCLGVCGSGGGKEHARKLNKQILQLSGGDELIGSEGFASHAGIVSAVEVHPAILFQTDEIGRIIKTLNNPNKSPHLYGISTVLMKMYTSSDSTYVGDAYADLKNVKKIYQPNPCLYGTTVPQSLYEGLSADSITDGFLSRMMIFESSDHDPKVRQAELCGLPETIIKRVKHWVDFKPGGNLSGEFPQPITIDHTNEAFEMIQSFESQCREERVKLDESLGVLWTRTNEKAHKLALLYACSQDGLAPEITPEATEWAMKLSRYLTKKMVYVASQWISETEYESRGKRIVRAIESAGVKGLSKTEIGRRFRHIKSKERDEILADLLTGRFIKMVQVKGPEDRGPARSVYTTFD